jgi:cytochrome P450
MKELEKRLQTRAHSLLQEAGSEFDAMTSVAAPLPVQAVTHLLHWPSQGGQRLVGGSNSTMLVTEWPGPDRRFYAT